MSLIPLKFPQADQITLDMTAVKKIPDPANPTQLITVPFDLTGAVITLYRKVTRGIADNDPSVLTSNGVIDNAVNGQYRVTITTAMLTPAGEYVYLVRAAVGGTSITLQYGPLIAEDT
jgi:hypothetical protein